MMDSPCIQEIMDLSKWRNKKTSSKPERDVPGKIQIKKKKIEFTKATTTPLVR
jgi:hypothetical protein